MMFSDCCGCEMNGIQMDYGLCPDCGEHCEVVIEDDDMENAREEIQNMSFVDYISLPLYHKE